jgi:CubicO group peptidase (beta-lactamase class C family)
MMQYYRWFPIFFFGLLLSAVTNAQTDMKDYEGHWESGLSNNKAFHVNISIKKLPAGRGMLTLTGGGVSSNHSFTYQNNKPFTITIGEDVLLKGVIDPLKNELSFFVQAGQWLHHVPLQYQGTDTYTGKWQVLLNEEFRSPFYLSIENAAGEQYEAYAFAADPRWPGFGCYNFSKKDSLLHFNDFRSGIRFEGLLLKDTIALTMRSAGLVMAKLNLYRSPSEWNLKPAVKASTVYQPPINRPDGLTVGNIHDPLFRINEYWLSKMVDSINAGAITETHSVLIALKGKLVYEQYFGGFDAATLHDTRSASKSIGSAIVGIAMDKGYLRDTAQKLFSLLPASYRESVNTDARKASINIGNLLTMSSGLDAVDFGINRRSAASEDVYQQTADWLKTVTDAPMLHEPGAHALYSSANPFLLGVALNQVVPQPLEFFIDQRLLQPLQIKDYILQQDDQRRPYFGGGMFFTPRDLLKFGLLYANKGNWKGRQLISSQWVKASFGKYLVLENHPEKNEYGFFWWHYQYRVGGQTIASIEARGAGGQYIFIIPDYDLVAVVTSGNFRNGRVWQPEKIMENYILPALRPSIKSPK